MPILLRNHRNRFHLVGEQVRLRRLANNLLFVALACLAGEAQGRCGQSTFEDAMSAPYAAAQKAQSLGDLTKAELEYKRFLSEALRRLARRRASAGDLTKAITLLDAALELTPNDADLRLEFAKACRSSGDLPKAKVAAENVLTLEPRNAKAHLELGLILSKMGEDSAASAHFEAAVAIDTNFENGYALAKEYLKRKDPEHASKIFAEMQAGVGDSPELHMEFGSAYAEMGFPERGIPEFEKALAKDDKIRGGHYSLGAAYLLGLGNVMQDKAQAEFQKELQNYPDDPLSLYQLGNIEFTRREFATAERDLTKAEKLDERNPDTYLLLGQIYNESGRATEAEAGLRKSIALTTDVAKNNYQVQRAHYLLARILMQSGRTTEAKLEMKTADDLQKQSTTALQGLTVPPDGTESKEIESSQVQQDSEKLAEADAFERKIKAAVADSYNNLGAIAATANDFGPALSDFQKAAMWQSSMEGLDYNWGRAAFSAGDYKQAIEPLARHLAGHADDQEVRAALGSSYFLEKRYQDAVKTLRPLEQSLDSNPQLGFIYAVSEVKSGETAAGVTRLLNLKKTQPNVALIPEALAEVYSSMGENEKAAREREIAKAIQDKQPGTTTLSKPN